MKMSEHSPQTDLLPMELPLMSSAEVSPVRISAARERRLELARKLAADCFAILSGSPRILALPISFLRTSPGFSRDQRKARENGSVNFSGPWPRSGMMRSGFVSPLPPLERRTSGTESGLLPTPTKHNSKEGAYPAEYTRNTPTLATHAGGRINPEWSEHLMGFPTKWTELEP